MPRYTWMSWQGGSCCGPSGSIDRRILEDSWHTKVRSLRSQETQSQVGWFLRTIQGYSPYTYFMYMHVHLLISIYNYTCSCTYTCKEENILTHKSTIFIVPNHLNSVSSTLFFQSEELPLVFILVLIS